jgi:hypothetical protein
MKKTIGRVLAWMAVSGAFLFLAAALPASTINTVRDAVLRDSPSFLGKAIGAIASGESITLVREEGAWAGVQFSGTQGWLPVSALRTHAVSLGAGSSRAAAGADSSEVALAGKGFTQQTEASFRAAQSGLDYATVDMMAGFSVPPEDCEIFLRTGREGGGR